MYTFVISTAQINLHFKNIIITFTKEIMYWMEEGSCPRVDSLTFGVDTVLPGS